MPRPLALLTLLLALDAGAVPARVAVTYFDINGGTDEHKPLGKGMADMLITDLMVVKSISLVERSKLNTVMAELKLSQSPYADKNAALKLGKVLAATHMLTGAITVLGSKMRIDARVLNASTGAVVQGKQVEGETKEFFDLEKELVDLLIAALEVKPDQKEKSSLRKAETESYDAFVSYSAGLEASDKGDGAKAHELFLKALQADPNYRSAKSASERLSALYAKVDTEKAEGFDAAFKKLNPKDKGFAAEVERLLQETEVTRDDGMKRKLALLTWLAERDLLPSTIPGFSRVGLDAMSLVGRFSGCPDQFDDVLATCDYFAQRIPKDGSVLGTCRGLLSGIERDRKDPAGLDRKRASCAKDWAQYKTMSPDDWRRPLGDHHPGIVALMKVYAAKARK